MAPVNTTTLKNTVKSLYRPFGNLPTDADVQNPDHVTGIMGGSCAAVGISLVLFFIITVILARNFQRLKSPLKQRTVVMMMAGSCLTLAAGFISVADSVTQYPDAQSSYGHAFESLSFIGLIALVLPVTFYKPIANRLNKDTEPLKEKITIAVVGGCTLILVSFTIATLCLKNHIPFELLVTIMVMRLVSVCMSACVGAWIISSSYRFQYDGYKYDQEEKDWKTHDGKKYESRFHFGRRLSFLGAVTLLSIVYVAIISVEGPMSLALRLSQSVILLLVLITLALFAWSHFITFNYILKENGDDGYKSTLVEFVDQAVNFGLGSATTVGIMDGTPLGIVDSTKKRLVNANDGDN